MDIDCALEGTEGESPVSGLPKTPRLRTRFTHGGRTTRRLSREDVAITFAQDGDYDVEVVVTDDDGATTSAFARVRSSRMFVRLPAIHPAVSTRVHRTDSRLDPRPRGTG